MSDEDLNFDVDKIVKHWIETSNLNARYDDFKREFYSLCTTDFTKDWIEKIKTIRTWIKQML